MLQKLIDHANLNKLLVIGDIILDSFVTGNIDNIAVSSSVPEIMLSSQNYTHLLGGACNVVQNIHCMGNDVIFTSVCGTEDNSKIIQKLLADLDITTNFYINEKIQIIKKLRITAQKQQIMRVDFEKKYIPLPLNILQNIDLQSIKFAVLSDYNKGCLQNVTEIIDCLHENNIKILIDPKGNDFSIYRNAYLITPNLSEFEAIVGKINNQEELVNAAVNISKNLNIDYILVTQGKDGMTLVDKLGNHHHLQSQAQKVYDVTGAGDTVISTIAVALNAGFALYDSIYLANLAASIAVAKFGIIPVMLHELNSCMSVLNSTPNIIISRKILKKLEKFYLKYDVKYNIYSLQHDIIDNNFILELKKLRQHYDVIYIELKDIKQSIHSLAERQFMLQHLSFIDGIIIG